jgi:hypothetical protein
MPPNFQAQQAQRMHIQAAQTQQRMHRAATDAALRAGRSTTPPMRPVTHWGGGGGTARGPFRLVGFLFKLVFSLVLLALALAFGPKLIDQVSQQMDDTTGGGSGGGGVEQPAPVGP